jgi:anti-sigma-K factor RsiG
VADETGNRRIDRIKRADYAQGLEELSLDDVRDRRDECRAELEYLSLLRRLVQGRAEILKAEVERRRDPQDSGSLVDRLAEILAPDEGHVSSRGAAVQVGVPDDELAIARRRVERLVADAGISDPGSLPDDSLATAVDLLFTEERSVSADRAQVIAVLEAVQDELKRRYKEDVSQVLS